MKRAVIYARASTKAQNVDMQIEELKSYATLHNYQVIEIHHDIGSGFLDERVGFNKVINAAKSCHIDVVLVWRFDRFSRSAATLLNYRILFEELGINFISCNENIDLKTNMGRLLFTIHAAYEEFEGEAMRQRTKTGVRRKIDSGAKWGRDKLEHSKRDKIKELAEIMSVRAIAKELNSYFYSNKI